MRKYPPRSDVPQVGGHRFVRLRPKCPNDDNLRAVWVTAVRSECWCANVGCRLPRQSPLVAPQRGIPRAETAGNRPACHSSNFPHALLGRIDLRSVELRRAASGAKSGSDACEAAHARHTAGVNTAAAAGCLQQPRKGGRSGGHGVLYKLTRAGARVHCFLYFAFTSSPVRVMCLIHSELWVKAAGRFPSPVKC